MTEASVESRSSAAAAVLPRSLNDELSSMAWLTGIQLPLTPIGVPTNIAVLTPAKTPWTLKGDHSYSDGTPRTKRPIRRKRPKDGVWKKPPLQFSTLMYIAIANSQPPHLTAPQICNYIT
jgi:hypothetical protein